MSFVPAPPSREPVVVVDGRMAWTWLRWMTTSLTSTVNRVGGYFREDGAWAPPHLADAAAVNDSVYFSTTGNRLAYKDSGGIVNYLY